MPPHVPRKRLREDSPDDEKPKRQQLAKGRGKAPIPNRRKATLYDDLDAPVKPQSSKHAKSALETLQDSDSESSLTSLSDAGFEDVPLARQQNIESSSDDDDDDIEFEDVTAPDTSMLMAPEPSGDLELTLHRDTRISLTNPFGTKKGASKLERKVRNVTHCVHVQLLLWHNAVRNAWLCDPEIQAILMSHIPPRLWDEVDRWKKNSGLDEKPKATPKKDLKGKTKAKARTRGKTAIDEDAKDWGPAAIRLEEGAVDMSHGDPLFRLMKSLVAWWKQRFRITAPGGRKWGYMSLERLDRFTKAWGSEEHDSERFGERIRNLEEFRKCAQDCVGSRDVGSQLFTALLRTLGLEARMVANLQPLGFGWTKMEEADPEKEELLNGVTNRDHPVKDKKNEPSKTSKTQKLQGVASSAKETPSSGRRTSKRPPVIEVDDSDDLSMEHADSDDESVIEISVTPRKGPPAKQYDKDLEFPHYWTEVLSPVTQKWLPIDPIVKSVVGTSRELIESLEPRGGKADKARQVIAYVVGYSPDGTAKDVTVRYLKRHMTPGRTKGMRLPVEKVPVYNRHGKVKRYELFDWFKTAMHGYTRGSRKHPITDADEAEASTDLKPAKPEKKEVKEGAETLQYYKQSKEYCLERHLKREEALLPNAAPVRVFNNKGKGSEPAEEMVYLRSEVVQVKSAETWHKQGRARLPGERPLKSVPYRAATTRRRREIAEAEAASGEKPLQGLYSFDQTDWIIPPPIKDGIIPKNDYGNIDLFMEHMCPEGAVHVPYRSAMKVCKKMQIDYAEAVVDFEFGHRMAVPVIQGVVIAEEYHDQVMEEIQKEEAERERKEDEKRKKAALGMWRKLLMGMRIVRRIREDYGEIDETVEVFGHKHGSSQAAQDMQQREEDMAGGFFPEGHDEEEVEPKKHTSSYFPVLEEGGDDEDEEGDLVVDHGNQRDSPEVADSSPDAESSIVVVKATPRSKRAAPTPGSRRSTRRKQDVTYDEDSGDE